jgi:hypothetical protein
MNTWKNRAQKLLIIHICIFLGSFFRAAHTAENWFPILEIRLRHPLFFLLCASKLENSIFAPSIVYVTDGHPERAFVWKSQTFGLGQTNWAEKCRGILGIFSQTTVSILALWVSTVLSICFVCFLQKTLDFRPKTYKSQINPK